MHHLVRKRVLEMTAVPDLVRADEDAVRGLEPAALPLDAALGGQPRGAPPADDAVGPEAAAVVELGDAVVEEAHDGRVAEEPVAVGLCALDVAGLVGAVARLAVVEDAFLRDAACEDVEVVHPPACARVEARAGGVVLEVEVWLGGCF